MDTFSNACKASSLLDLAHKSFGIHLRDKFSLLRPSACTVSSVRNPPLPHGKMLPPKTRGNMGGASIWKHGAGLDLRCPLCSGGDERRAAVSRGEVTLLSSHPLSLSAPPLITPAHMKMRYHLPLCSTSTQGHLRNCSGEDRSRLTRLPPTSPTNGHLLVLIPDLALLVRTVTLPYLRQNN